MENKIIFFAYKGKRENEQDDNTESIKYATKNYNKYQAEYKAVAWEDYGNFFHIPYDVKKSIEECEVFVCDLTYFSYNVLFELGYAVGKNKQILVLLRPNVNNAENKYQESFLKDIFYVKFKNSEDIRKSLARKDWKNGLFEKYTPVKKPDKNSIDLLYIKSRLDNEPYIELNRKIESLQENWAFSLSVDDLLERYRSVNWYFQEIYKAKCVLIHFWASNAKDAPEENAKNCFFAGLACGLDKKVLLVIPAPLNSPIDCNDISVSYQSSDYLVKQVDDWLNKELINTHIEEKIEKQERHRTDLFKLGIGNEVAEREKDRLLEYFVETSTYYSALKKERIIIVGRKGTGKTAIYIKLLDDLSKGNLNYVINLKPEPSDLLQNIQLSDVFKNIADKRYFFVSAWKLTIFSKLIYCLYEKILQKAGYEYYSIQERNLVDFVKQHEAFIKMSVFGIVNEICNKAKDRNNANSPQLLGELYREYLRDLLKNVKGYFKSIRIKYNKIIIIADNLDQAWNNKINLDIQSEMIASLLEIEDKIKKELVDKSDNKIDLKIIIFLRKDIFEYILKNIDEGDKFILLKDEIEWEKYPELLKKVIENRFKIYLDLKTEEEIAKTWQEFFDLKGKDPFVTIKNIVISRPRDVIYFVSRLFSSAYNRDVDKVTEIDFKNAMDNYIDFLNGNLIAELIAEYPQIRHILNKLSIYDGQYFEYREFLKILDEYKLENNKREEFTKLLFEKGYMQLYDVITNQASSNINILHAKLKEKKWLIVPAKVYVLANANYHKIKEAADKLEVNGKPS